MSLTTCPECSGKVSDKAYSCPHCGFPLRDGISVPRRAKTPGKRRRNGTGTIVKLSGSRRKPFQVRVNTRIDEWGYPRYDVLGNFPDRVSADIALAEYNKDPFDIANRKKTFEEVFKDWYEWKYKAAVDTPGKRTSSQYCTLISFTAGLCRISRLWICNRSSTGMICLTPCWSTSRRCSIRCTGMPCNLTLWPRTAPSSFGSGKRTTPRAVHPSRMKRSRSSGITRTCPLLTPC